MATQIPTEFRRICVFCGHNPGNDPVFLHAATELGYELARRHIELVYGGGNLGLMGAISKAASEGGSLVFGVVPENLVFTIGLTAGITQVVTDMHQQKALMSCQADAFIVLPGGYGTLEEMFGVVTRAQIGFHYKPVGLLNVNGYYDTLLSFIDQAVYEGFVSRAGRPLIISAPTIQELLYRMEGAQDVTAIRLTISNPLMTSSPLDDLKARFTRMVNGAQSVEALKQVVNCCRGHIRLYENSIKRQRKRLRTTLTTIEETEDQVDPTEHEVVNLGQSSPEAKQDNMELETPSKRQRRLFL